jgi:type IV pilus assembly protein PilB
MTEIVSLDNTNVVLRFLLEKNKITQEEIDLVNNYARANEMDIIQALQESGVFGDGESIVATIAEEAGYEYLHLSDIDIDRHALNVLDQKQASTLMVLPYALIEGTLHVAVPIGAAKSVQLKSDLRRLTKIGMIQLAIAGKKDILKTIDTLYRSDAELANLSRQAQKEATNNAAENEDIPDEITGESDVVRFVDLVLRQGVKDGASDIHFDPQEDALKIRYRIDGILRPITEAPIFMMPEIVSRIKIMASLDISKTREPQDGRLSMSIHNKEIDFRIATLPSIHGEKIVMRILDNSAAQMALTDLGFSETNLKRFRVAARKPYGILLVTGPTGSGKSTTLYAALNEINSPEINIITVEDPIEYQLAGITQVPVRHNLTFERVLRTVLRADPDVILIGEIRDKETADIAMKAGMTGHMVFSTLHTNDAASALTRLGDMGVESFITASTVEGIVSQRLIRRLCVKCKEEETTLSQEYLDSVGFTWDEEVEGGPVTFYKPVGCKLCNRTGYKGRLAIHEVLLMSDELEEAVIKGAKALQLASMAREDGMVTLKEDGYHKAAQGLTTIQEILRVVA